MKKFLIIILSFFTMNTVMAFNIDVDKIEIDSRSKSLVNSLDSSYKIELKDFNNSIVSDKEALTIVKDLIKITLGNQSESEKINEYTKKMFIDKNDGNKALAAGILRDTYFSEMKKYKIADGYLSDIKTVPFNDDLLAFAYIKDAKVNEEETAVVFTYWLKKDNGEYKVYYPWITVGNKMTDFFEKISDNEEKGNVIGATYKMVSLKDGEKNFASEELLKKIYDNCNQEVVQISGMANNGLNVYGSGFFIREGVVVTSWSLFQQFLANSDYIYVNDSKGKTYKVEGIVAAQIDYDVVILKLKNEVGKSVEFVKSSSLNLDDNLFMINSKNNNGFSINYGTFVSSANGRLKNLFAISQSEVGSAVFNTDGKVVGFAVADQLYSELSFANSTDYLMELQRLLVRQDFSSIKSTKIDSFKEKYYVSLINEKKYFNVAEKDYKRLSKVGNLEKNIKLDLIKASYEDRILSLRYRSLDSDSIDSFYLIANFMDELSNQGFVLVQNTNNKKIYESGDYRVVIKKDFNYLIVLIVEK